jgi:rhodanese-related sulfurtransferase
LDDENAGLLNSGTVDPESRAAEPDRHSLEEGIFTNAHSGGARSIPFPALANPKRILRWRQTTRPIYVVADDRVKGSLATGILRAAGYMNSTLVDGGMTAWVAYGLPVLSKGYGLRTTIALRGGSIALGILALITLALMKILIGTLIGVSALALFIKARLIERSQTGDARPDWATL